jgi:S1-C subfamily serine protease
LSSASAASTDLSPAAAAEGLRQLNAGMADVVARVRGSLVRISNGRRGHGAGTIWHEQGLVLTNAHVVHGRSSLKVTLPDGETLPARLLAADPDRDLAALSVEAEGLPTTELGDSKALRAGDFVLALGHPWGVQGAAAAGVFISMENGLPEGPGNGRELLAVGLQLRPGHSGGPLVDAGGRLVGINTMMAGPEVGVAIPVHVVKRFLRDALGA